MHDHPNSKGIWNQRSIWMPMLVTCSKTNAKGIWYQMSIWNGGWVYMLPAIPILCPQRHLGTKINLDHLDHINSKSIWAKVPSVKFIIPPGFFFTLCLLELNHEGALFFHWMSLYTPFWNNSDCTPIHFII